MTSARTGSPTGGRAVVAAGHEAVCDAAEELLLRGGNAYDAVAGAGFAAAVVEPALTSLGGGGFLLARTRDGRAELYDFFVDTPGRALPSAELEPHFVPITVRFPGNEQVFNTGLGSAAVPGVLQGLLEVHGELGRLSLQEVISPAARLARHGVTLNGHQAYFLELLQPIMCLTPAAAALYAPGGRPPEAGQRLRNPDLAAFLESLPSGAARDLYEGALGERVARDMRDGRGLLTREDLREYQVVRRKPLTMGYRGLRLLTNPAPSFGGTLLALGLRLLEPRRWPPGDPDSLEYAVALLEVMQEMERRRESETRPIRSFGRGTTHVSICDAAGNVASMTTSNGEGSGYIVPGTGIMLNNMLGEDDLHPDGFHAAPPGERVASMMSPSVLLDGAAVRLVIGSGGSKRIRSVLLQVISRIADFDRPIREAVEHPRLHWDGEQVQLEPGFPERLREALRAAAPVNDWDRLDVYFGGVHAVAPGPEGGAAGDPRRGGAARVIDLG